MLTINITAYAVLVVELTQVGWTTITQTKSREFGREQFRACFIYSLYINVYSSIAQ